MSRSKVKLLSAATKQYSESKVLYWALFKTISKFARSFYRNEKSWIPYEPSFVTFVASLPTLLIPALATHCRTSCVPVLQDSIVAIEAL